MLIGQNKGFHVERDEVGNILIRKPATPGYENRKGVVLQAHLDMVPQKITTRYMTLKQIQFVPMLMVSGLLLKAPL
ncbi:hypothetical protein J4727_11645 [Providencia rettgeri]|uniref:Cytosol nonspecific dipeptidase n=1 Tax=Providencia rettgeri TaxID=587 RepID=A0A939SJC4_PRORE|nr:hypothetical protein [Providencia rettgeri]